MSGNDSRARPSRLGNAVAISPYPGIMKGLELAAGIAMTLSDLMTAVVGWAVAKVRGYDLSIR